MTADIHDTSVVGINVPARVGMRIEDVETPALVIDLGALVRNIERMQAFVEARGIRLRAHAKTHKSVDIARLQIERGGACGVCCQKVSEAEAMVAGGIRDILISNEIVSPPKIARMAELAKQARIIVCVDDAGNVADLSEAAVRACVVLECLVEIDVGAGRCGVEPGAAAVDLARIIDASKGLKFSGLQAYNGAAQHIRDFDERVAAIEKVTSETRQTVETLSAAGLDSEIIGGAGTGSYDLEAARAVINELQCGSYVFMDGDYGCVRDEGGAPKSDFENSLFILTSIMSHAKPGKAVCDAGLKVQSVDSGLPHVFGRDDVTYVKCNDEHGEILDPNGVLELNDRLMLVPGHCDPTVNLHDWYVGVRDGVVEHVWPVTARGRVW